MTNPFTDPTSVISRETDLELRLELIQEKLNRTRTYILIAFMLGVPFGAMLVEKGLQ